MLAAKRLGEDESRIALVHEENLAAGNRAEVGNNVPERDALARAGRTFKQRVPGVEHMQVEARWRAAAGGAVAERRSVLRIVGAWIDREPRPDAGQRHDVGEVARAYQRFPHVIPAVDRDRAEPGLDG